MFYPVDVLRKQIESHLRALLFVIFGTLAAFPSAVYAQQTDDSSGLFLSNLNSDGAETPIQIEGYTCKQYIAHVEQQSPEVMFVAMWTHGYVSAKGGIVENPNVETLSGLAILMVELCMDEHGTYVDVLEQFLEN